jgi:hypothetical protein
MMAQDSVESQLVEIRRVLDRLGTLRLGPVLPLVDVATFERRHRVELPLGFRRFILEVGNGGDGPGNGLAPFDPHSEQPRVSHPFPLDGLWVWADEDAPDPERIAACRDGWLTLGTEGCGMDWVLIVSGAQRGSVWNIESQGAQPCAPALDFLSWYAAWCRWMATGGPRSKTSWWDVVWADYATTRG